MQYPEVQLSNNNQVSEPVVTSVTFKTVWHEWRDFVTAKEQKKSIHDYSAEKYGVVICGKKIWKKRSMSARAYEETIRLLSTKHNIQFKDMFADELPYVDDVLDAEQSEMLQCARELAGRTVSPERLLHRAFLSDVLVYVVRELFASDIDLSYSQSEINERIVLPVLKFALLSMENNKRGLKFYPGEERLQSMSTQLEANGLLVDARSCYKTDGVLRCAKSHKDMELLLLETSNGYDQADNTKVIFDFHKGIFGALAMIKTIADNYKFAKFDVMSKLRLYFVHAHTKHIRLWSISCPAKGVFVVYEEDECEIPAVLKDSDKLPDYMRFIWALKGRLDETMDCLDNLERSNQERKHHYRYTDPPADEDLSKIVEPSL